MASFREKYLRKLPKSREDGFDKLQKIIQKMQKGKYDYHEFTTELSLFADFNGGVMKLVDKAKLCNQSFYRVFNNRTQPRFDTIMKILNSMDIGIELIDLKKKK